MQDTVAGKRYYKIGDLIEFTGLKRSVLNHYINIRLIHPNHKHRNSGHRMFDEDSLKRLNRIKVLKKRTPKLGLAEIKDILDNELPL